MVTLLINILMFTCRDSTMSEDKELAYDCPLQLEENPAYEAMQK